MGYIDAEQSEDFKNTEVVGLHGRQEALCVMDFCPVQLYSGFSGRAYLHSALISNLHMYQIGDKFRLDLDFKARTCTAFYNDESLGLISEYLPPQLYLAVALCGSRSVTRNSVVTTLFD